jgi:hypothetical protein
MDKGILRAAMLIVGLAGFAGSANAQRWGEQALCHDYAKQAVATYQSGILKGCNMQGSGLSDNYDRMWKTCFTWPNARIKNETKGIPMKLQVACRAPQPRARPTPGPNFRSGPGGMPQGSIGDPTYCRNVYANNLTNLWAQGQAKGCRAYLRRNNNFAGHYDRCLARPRAVTDRAIVETRRAVATCR